MTKRGRMPQFHFSPSPCQDCDRRTSICHAHCEDYAAYAEKQEQKRQERQARHEKEQYMYKRKKVF